MFIRVLIFILAILVSLPINADDDKRKNTPFISGYVSIPPILGINNEGTITGQTVLGQTHIQAQVMWRLIESDKGVWDFSSFDDMLALSKQHHLKMAVFPWLQYAPNWFKQSVYYTPVQDAFSGATADILSPWNPDTMRAYDHFYGELSRRYHDDIDIILVGYPGSDYGEVGLPMGAQEFLPDGYMYPHFPQEPGAWQAGWWCGDAFARKDFRTWATTRYGTLSDINKTWGTTFENLSEVTFPNPDDPDKNKQHWLDFVQWYQNSQTECVREMLKVVRRHFPKTRLQIGLGHATEDLRYGLDRTALCRAAADFQPIDVRSTHASTNRWYPPMAYWFYKRMAPTCHRYGVGFGTEPPGGDLEEHEILRQYFEDASAGINFFYTYFQNYHLRRHVVGEMRRLIQPERSMVDIAVLYPSTQMALDQSLFPPGQLEFCADARDYFDYDIVDENMIGWGMLNNYRVLIKTSGNVFRPKTVDTVRAWAALGGQLLFADVDDRADSLQNIVETLKLIDMTGKLDGFDGENDGNWTTDFSNGQLIYNVEKRKTVFHKYHRE